MKKYEVVKTHDDFNEIINKGSKISNRYFIIFSMDKKSNYPKFGIAVGKKIGNAVMRNKYKRRLRNIIDNNKFLFEKSFNYIIIVKKECLGVPYNLLESNLVSLMKG